MTTYQDRRAEREYYAPAHRAANGAFRTVDELEIIRGMDAIYIIGSLSR
jgi:type II secretory pathway component PulK